MRRLLSNKQRWLCVEKCVKTEMIAELRCCGVICVSRVHQVKLERKICPQEFWDWTIFYPEYTRQTSGLIVCQASQVRQGQRIGLLNVQ